MRGAGPKSFCAGGDVAKIVKVGKESGREVAIEYGIKFLREEFRMDYQLAKMRPVQISILDGYVLGGGNGISINSKIKIATEKTLMGMPEAKIGFFCDVGVSYVLSRLQNGIGEYICLTSQFIKGEDIVKAKLADHFVKSENIP